MYSIRGKRHKRAANPSNKQHTGRRGRPLKPPSALRQSKQTLAAQLKTYQQENQASEVDSGKLSSLESLPTELLQQVFFHCLEVNLPRASPHLARALSTEITYRVLILFAYFDEDKAAPVETRLFLPARYRRISLEDKIDLQADIFGCRWCTFARLSACLPALCRLQIAQQWRREQEAASHIKNRFGEKLSLAIEPQLLPLSGLPELTDYNKSERHFLARWRLPTDVYASKPKESDQSHLPRIAVWAYQVEDEEQGSVALVLTPGRSVLAARYIPACLLRSAAKSADQLKCIQLLRQGFEFVEEDFVMRISTQALVDGLIAAIQACHVEAVVTLLDLHATFVQKEAYNEPGADQMSHTSSRASLPPEVFRTATRQGTESSTLIWLLMQHDLGAIPYDDDSLTKWAVRRKLADDDPVAGWLLDHMVVRDRDDTRAATANNKLPALSAERILEEDVGYLRSGRISATRSR